MKFGKLFQTIKNFFFSSDKPAEEKHPVKEEVPIKEETPAQEISEPERISFGLDMSLEYYSMMENLAQVMSCSVTDMLQKSIDLMKISVNAKLQGKKIGIFNSDKKLETEIVGFIPGDNKKDIPKNPLS